jgi:hypothetical protein
MQTILQLLVYARIGNLRKEKLCHWFVLMFAKVRMSLTAKKLAGLLERCACALQRPGAHQTRKSALLKQATPGAALSYLERTRQLIF